MKKCVRLLFLLFLTLTLIDRETLYYAGVVQQPQKQPGPGKKFVQTPFGVDEVDISDPRPGVAFGPPAQPATPPGNVAAQPPAAAGQVQPDDVVPVKLRFNNSDLYTVIDTIAEITQINFIVDPQVRGTVTMYTAGDIRRSDLLPMLEAILKVNGATMVKVGNLYQIVPANAAVRMPLEVQNTRAVAPDDQVVLQIVPMRFVAAEEMVRLLTPFISDTGNLVAQGSMLLITDRRSNLRKLLELVDEFDMQAFQGERVRLLAIKNNRVRDVIDDLKTVFSGYALSTNSAIRFLPIERMNSILVVTPNADVFPEVEKWLDRLDQPVQTAGIRNYVYPAKNARASDIQRVLVELYSVSSPTPQQQIPQQAPGVAPQIPGTAPRIPPTPNEPLTGAPQPPTGITGRLAGELRIVVDAINNQLVIQATPQDYQIVERTIQQLDVLPRQVLIDAQVYEVSLDHSMTFGVSAILQNRGTLNPAMTTAGFDRPPGSNLTATTFAFIGRSRELVAFLNASENRGRVKTLSAPSILVSNNATAQVQIGAEIPIPTSTAASNVLGENGTLFAQTIQFRNTGVILDVTPQINEGGNVTLTIAQEVSQAGVNTTSAINAPVIGKSSVKSTIVVKNGETIPLTGFIRDSNTLSRNRIPLLGSIPVAGVLFGNTTKSNTRSELIVLITPHVITTVDERLAASEELKARLKEIQRHTDLK